MQGDGHSWETWATAWELAALSLRYPEDDVLAEAVLSSAWTGAAHEVRAALGLEMPARWDDGLPHAEGGPAEGATPDDVAALRHALRVEATRLMVGAPDPAASPYEGVWRAADDGVAPLLMVSPYSMRVERFIRACGLGRPADTNEPLDHVATECELLSHLALRAAGAPAPDGAPSDGELPGGSAADAYELFVSEHARAWMPRFAATLADVARHPLYRAAGRYLAALVAVAGEDGAYPSSEPGAAVA